MAFFKTLIETHKLRLSNQSTATFQNQVFPIRNFCNSHVYTDIKIRLDSFCPVYLQTVKTSTTSPICRSDADLARTENVSSFSLNSVPADVS